MANICVFSIEATGEPACLQALAQFVARGVEENQGPQFEKYILWLDKLYDDLTNGDHKYIWLEHRDPCGNNNQFVVGEGPFWYTKDRNRLLLHGTSIWAPPQRLVERLSRQYSDLDFTFGGTTEHEIAESWTCKAGVSKCEWVFEENIPADKIRWYVRDGQEVQPLEWIDNDLEEMAAMEAKIDDIVGQGGTT